MRILPRSPAHSSPCLVLVNSDVFNAQVSFSQSALERRQASRQQRVGFWTLDMNLRPHRPFVHDGVNLQRAQLAGAKFHMHLRIVNRATERR